MAPIDRLRWEEVPGKPGAFLLFDKETDEPFDTGQIIMDHFNAGMCVEKK